MDNFNEYIENERESLSSMSNATYTNKIGISDVKFSFDTGSIYNEVCFARMWGQMNGKSKSSNYFMRLPYIKTDTDKDVHKYIVDYPVFFENISNLVESIYKVSIYNTPYNNVKVVTFENKIELIKCLDYSITLLLFCLLRGVEGEYNNQLNSYKTPLSGDLKEYIYWLSSKSRGSHHNVNDVLDKILHNSTPETFKKLVSNTFIDILYQTFSKNGLVNNPNYQKYFTDIFKTKPEGYGWAMQTKSFDFINLTTNKIILESLL